MKPGELLQQLRASRRLRLLAPVRRPMPITAAAPEGYIPTWAALTEDLLEIELLRIIPAAGAVQLRFRYGRQDLGDMFVTYDRITESDLWFFAASLERDRARERKA